MFVSAVILFDCVHKVINMLFTLQVASYVNHFQMLMTGHCIRLFCKLFQTFKYVQTLKIVSDL